MVKWEKLQPGDVIDIIAPGYPTKPEIIEAGKIILQERGYIPRVPADILSPQFFHSNSDEARFAQAKKALLAKDSKAIWCLRGGYGSNRLLPELAKIKKPNRAKIFIGISDVTSLHLFLNQNWKWCTLHATLLDRLAENRIDAVLAQEIFDIINGKKHEMLFTGLKPLNARAEKTKKHQARIVGGNLTTLQCSIGTPWALKTSGEFLFLEDLGERGYRIDRMLVHLKQAGRLKNCEGILLGHFTGGDEPLSPEGTTSNRVHEALQRFADENPNLPVWSGIESGHGELLRTLPFGTPATIVQKNGEISLNVETGSR